MIQFANVTLRRGPRKLLEAVNFTLHAGERIGVVGRNGTGKSSLFQMIRGELPPDLGDVSVPSNLQIASVAQETPALPQSALDYVLDGDVELRSTEAALAQAEASHDVGRQARLHDRLAAIDGYAAPARAARLLDGLGFAHETQSRAVSSFSGGWRMRLNLAQALMCRSDLLLLDEPTNHLDLDAVLWLQTWLRSYPGTLLVISHDREFLDAVTTRTLHLHGGGARLWAGNYSQFEVARAEAMAQQNAQREAQQRQLAHLQSFVDRFRAKATKARQAQSRLKMIEKMPLIAAAHADAEFTFTFREPLKLPSPMLRLDKAAVGYGDKIQLSGLKLGIEPGDRIALLGPNGAGKSTLIRLLVGELEAATGSVSRAPDLAIGYFAQHQLEQLDVKASALLHLRRLDPQATEQSLRDYLGGFGFVGDRVYEPVGPFSGGEKSRLALAMVVYRRPNLLLLDEPTNHLDLDLRHALEMALNEFAGAVVLVSHDRHLVTSCCDELWRVADGRCERFDGDLDDYAAWLSSRGSSAAAAAGKAAPRSASDGVDPAERKRQEREHKDRVRKLETRMQKLQAQLDTVEAKLADEGLYLPERQKDLHRLLGEQQQLKAQIEPVEAEWFEAMERLEALAG